MNCCFFHLFSLLKKQELKNECSITEKSAIIFHEIFVIAAAFTISIVCHPVVT